MNTLSIYNSTASPLPPVVYNVAMKKLPNRIRYFRELKGMSQESLGKAVGRTKDTISKWERGDRKLKMDEAGKLARVLHTSIGNLVDEIEPIHYQANDDIMLKSADAVTKAAAKLKIKLPLREAMTYTLRLYNLVMESKGNGDAIEPSETIAVLILKQSA